MDTALMKVGNAFCQQSLPDALSLDLRVDGEAIDVPVASVGCAAGISNEHVLPLRLEKEPVSLQRCENSLFILLPQRWESGSVYEQYLSCVGSGSPVDADDGLGKLRDVPVYLQVTGQAASESEIQMSAQGFSRPFGRSHTGESRNSTPAQNGQRLLEKNGQYLVLIPSVPNCKPDYRCTFPGRLGIKKEPNWLRGVFCQKSLPRSKPIG